jgi:hypothetical protein
MQGTFRLQKASVDPLLTNYDVLDVRWALPNAAQNVTRGVRDLSGRG